MKKTILSLTAVTLAAVATPALAGNITAEVRFADVRGGRAPDSTEYRVEYAAPLNSLLNYGAEIQVKQPANAGPVNSLISAKVGPNLPDVLGFHTAAYGEFGQSLKQGDTYLFWGAAAKASHQLYGPVSVNVGYRHREAFQTIRRMTENRLNGGLALDIGSGNTVGVNYYRTRGTTRADAIGVALNHTF